MEIITVTEAAALHIQNMLERAGKKSVELGLVEQGCNGYKYTWTPTDLTDFDNSVNIGNGYSIVFSKSMTVFIIDSVVDLAVEGLNTVLKINNPNVDHMCGCGESVNFNVK